MFRRQSLPDGESLLVPVSKPTRPRRLRALAGAAGVFTSLVFMTRSGFAVDAPGGTDYRRAEAAARQHPNDAALALEAGTAAGETAQYEEGLRWFGKAEKLDPRLLPAVTGQGQMWMALGRPGVAAACYNRALKLAPREPTLLLELARAYISLRDFRAALEAAQKAADIAPDSPEVHRAFALIHSQLLQHEDARKSAERACELEAKDPENWAVLGSVEIANGRYAAAGNALKRALALDPGHVSSNLLYARVLTEGSKTPAAEKEAFAVLARARINDPLNVQALLLQGQIMNRAGNTDLAVSLLRQAREGAPRDSAVLLALGQALAQSGRGEEGARLTTEAQRLSARGVSFLDLENLVQSNPDPTLAIRLADLYLRQEMPDSAARVLERALQRTPSVPALRTRLEQIRREHPAAIPGS